MNTRQTKKSIIKKLLIDELRSPEMRKRIESDRIRGYQGLIEWDLHSASDDELIEHAYELHSTKVPFFGTSNGHAARHILTPRAYLLLMAYRNSFSTLNKYFNHHKSMHAAALSEAATNNAWRLEYMHLCNELMSEVRQNLK